MYNKPTSHVQLPSTDTQRLRADTVAHLSGTGGFCGNTANADRVRLQTRFDSFHMRTCSGTSSTTSRSQTSGSCTASTSASMCSK